MSLYLIIGPERFRIPEHLSSCHGGRYERHRLDGGPGASGKMVDLVTICETCQVECHNIGWLSPIPITGRYSLELRGAVVTGLGPIIYKPDPTPLRETGAMASE